MNSCNKISCSSFLKAFIMLLFVVQLFVISVTADATDSLSNKVISIETETIDNEELLLIIVDTGIYDTRGSSDPSRNINPACGNDRAVFIRLDAQTPTEQNELQLIRQALETADIGPIRIRFSIIEDDCILFGLDTIPVASGVKLLQNKRTPSLAISKSLDKKDLNNDGDKDDDREDGNLDEDNSDTVSLNDTLNYKVTAKNSFRAATLTDVVVSDEQLTPNSEICERLESGESCVLTGTHVVTQSEVEDGRVSNRASASSSELPRPVTDSLNIAVPTFEITKRLYLNIDEDNSGTVSLNDTLMYFVEVNNISGTTYTNVVVSDAQLIPNSVTCDVVIPIVFNPCTLDGTYIVTQADVDTGLIVNEGSVISSEITRPRTVNNITEIGFVCSGLC